MNQLAYDNFVDGKCINVICDSFSCSSFNLEIKAHLQGLARRISPLMQAN
jgi:hypothetical protein